MLKSYMKNFDCTLCRLSWFSYLFLIVTVLTVGVSGSLPEAERSCLLQKPSAPSLLGTESDPILLCKKGERCRCDQVDFPFGEIKQDPPITEEFLHQCNARCFGHSRPAFQASVLKAAFDPQVFARCSCCKTLAVKTIGGSGTNPFFTYQVVTPSTTSTTSASANVVGDPHISTLDGKRYLLLSQGTFSLWHFSGVDAEDQGERVPVDWQVFTHYSGHQAFTKGLLLVDKSGNSQRQILEMTSSDCQWRTWMGNQWTAVPNGKLLSVPDGYVTGFIVTKVGPKRLSVTGVSRFFSGRHKPLG